MLQAALLQLLREDIFRKQIRTVCKEIACPHAFGCPEREVGGFLVGVKSECTDGSLRFPEVVSAIRASGAVEGPSRLTFTHETWEVANSEIEVHRERDGRPFEIVGWYHSHPNQGIFLSGMDRFIHRNFFSDTQQLAVVVDPLSRAFGAFIWKDGEVVSLFEQSIDC